MTVSSPTTRGPIGVAVATYFALVTLLFTGRLVDLVHHALSYDLHSHILIVPFVTVYLLAIRRASLPETGGAAVPGATACVAIGATALVAGRVMAGSLTVNDDLALSVLAYLAFLAAGGFMFAGAAWMKAAAFPIAFLCFMIPLPDVVVRWMETGSQLASAEAAAIYFRMAGTPLMRNGTVFELPNITLEVAQECSGIRSSLVLFITSLVASNLFLKGPWRRIALVAFVIPLGILRNGFRVLVIGLLCVHVGPHMIDSVIHHQGGPIFFALSLGPLFLALWWLRRGDQRSRSANSRM